MLETLIETVNYGSLASCGLSTSATVGETFEDPRVSNCFYDIFRDSIGTSYTCSTSSSTTIPTTAVTAIVGQGINDYDTVQAVTYIESCSNEEVNDMLNQIDELLDDNTNNKEDIKILSRRI